MTPETLLTLPYLLAYETWTTAGVAFDYATKTTRYCRWEPGASANARWKIVSKILGDEPAAIKVWNGTVEPADLEPRHFVKEFIIEPAGVESVKATNAEATEIAQKVAGMTFAERAAKGDEADIDRIIRAFDAMLDGAQHISCPYPAELTQRITEALARYESGNKIR